MQIDKVFHKSLSNAKVKVPKHLSKEITNNLKANNITAAKQGLWQSLSTSVKTTIISTAAAGVIATTVLLALPEGNVETNTTNNALVSQNQATDIQENTANNLVDTEKQALSYSNKNTEPIDDQTILNPNDSIPSEPANLVQNNTQSAISNPNPSMNQPKNPETKQEEKVEKSAQGQEHTLDNQTITPQQVRFNLGIPNFFSPNADGINDCFEIKYIEDYPDNMLIIKDRQGKIIYQKRNYNNDFCGENYPDGVYLYILQVRKNGQTKAFYGNISIIRH